jgi:hypothetical protein
MTIYKILILISCFFAILMADFCDKTACQADATCKAQDDALTASKTLD